jgi:hypothetical protein
METTGAPVDDECAAREHITQREANMHMTSITSSTMHLHTHLPPLQLVPMTPDEPEEEAAHETRTCGWFDSSFDLRKGLLVIELRAADAWFAACQSPDPRSAFAQRPGRA